MHAWMAGRGAGRGASKGRKRAQTGRAREDAGPALLSGRCHGGHGPPHIARTSPIPSMHWQILCATVGRLTGENALVVRATSATLPLVGEDRSRFLAAEMAAKTAHDSRISACNGILQGIEPGWGRTPGTCTIRPRAGQDPSVQPAAAVRARGELLRLARQPDPRGTGCPGLHNLRAVPAQHPRVWPPRASTYVCQRAPGIKQPSRL